MKAIAAISTIAFLCLTGVTPSVAKDADSKEPVRTSALNCDALNNSSLVCVVNKTHSTIREISCDGHLWGTSAIAVPGGRIPSGGIGVVNFNHGSCKSGIHIKTGDGQAHDIPGQDISALTILNIESEEW